MKKPYKKEHILNWYFGNFCAKCVKIDSEYEDYARKCYKKCRKLSIILKQKK